MKNMADSSSASRRQRLSSMNSLPEVDTGIIYEDLRRYTRRHSHDPTIEQTLGRYLQNGADENENQNQNGDSVYKEQTEKTKQILEDISPKYNLKYKVLLSYVAKWRLEREGLINKLLLCAKQLDDQWKTSTIVRLIASSVDISGSVGGLILRTQSGWLEQAFNATSFCGLCGLFSTVLEVGRSKRILDEVITGIKDDQKLLIPIINCFKEIKELDSVVQEIFPYGIDKKIVQDIESASAEQDGFLKLFRAALCSNVRWDRTLLQNEDFLHSLQIFARSEVAHIWWNSIFYRKHPIILDLHKIALQIEFKQLQNIVFQCIPALPLEQQKLTSLPAAGRILLNFLTMYDSFYDLRRGSKSAHSDKLRNLHKKMTEELEIVKDTIAILRYEN